MSSSHKSLSRSPTASPERSVQNHDPTDASEQSHRTNLKFWLEAKQRRQRSTASGSPASIVTTGDEVPRDDRRHDPSYRGRTPVRSRVGTVQSARDTDNRAAVKPRRGPRLRSHSADANIPTPRSRGRSPRFEPEDNPGDLSDGSIHITPPPPVPRALILQGLREARAKRAKSAAVVDSDSDYEERSQTRGASTSTPAKRGRRSKKRTSGGCLPASKKVRLEPLPFPMRSPSPLSPDVEMPTALSIIEDVLAKRRRGHRSPPRSAGHESDDQKSASIEGSDDASSRTPSPDPDYIRTYFFDDEVEDDEKDSDSSDEEKKKYEDEYDLDDPFIDDTPDQDSDVSMRSPEERRIPSKRRTKRSDPTDKQTRSHRTERASSPRKRESSRQYRLASPFDPHSSHHDSRNRRISSMDTRATRDVKTTPETPSKPSKRNRYSDAASSFDRRGPPGGYRMSTGGRSKNTLTSSSKKASGRVSSKSQSSSQPTVVLEISSDSSPERQQPPKPVKAELPHDIDVSVDDVKRPSKPKPRPLPKTKTTSASVNVRDSEAKPELAMHSVKKETGSDNEKAKKSKKDKGKGKAVVRRPSPTPLVEDDLVSDPELSAYERRQIRKAMRESKTTSTRKEDPSNTATPGASSSSSASPSTSTTVAVPSSSPATSLASSTKPGSSPISMQELVARARAAGGSPKDSGPAPPNPAAAGAVAAAVDPSFARRCITLPTEDETLFPELQDVILIPTYQGLVCLRSGRIIPWNDQPGKGFITFSAWADFIPHMNGGIAFAAVTFRESGPFRNPARTSPLDVGLRTIPGTNQRFNMYCATNPPVPFIGVSSGFCERSQLITTSENGLPSKYVIMIQHSQEFERTVGFIRTATGYTELHSQFARNGWQYSTKPQGSRGPASPGNAPGQKRSTPANMFKATPGNVTTRAGADNFSLPNDTTVPIYDARGLDSLDFDAVLPKLAESLPLYTEGEIPYGSFIVVGYTMMIYRANSGNWTLGNNIHWVIVVGIPDHN